MNKLNQLIEVISKLHPIDLMLSGNIITAKAYPRLRIHVMPTPEGYRVYLDTEKVLQGSFYSVMSFIELHCLTHIYHSELLPHEHC
jgi:hypothetical protein